MYSAKGKIMKTNENQKSTNHQPAAQKPFFGATPDHPFFSAESAASTPFFQPKAISPSTIQAKSATTEAENITQPLVQQMPAFESEVTANGEVQRKLINSSVLPIQTKLTIGEPGDKYEQEADRVASQVVEQINAPVSAQSTQGESLQRQEEPEEELQAKPEITTLQRMEEKPEELQAKSTLQRQEAIAVREASGNLESQINRARGSGQALDAGLQEQMGQAMGADFSGVRVHTDTQSDQLNQSIQAKAFTTGQDVFFRQGAYEPGSRGGQELIAHELTHVVQQTQKANDTNLSTKKAPVHTARPLKIQSSHSIVQRANGYKKLKKSEDPEVIWHKALGKELVATYRILSKVTAAIGEGKNKEALKEVAIGMAKAGISVATMLSGIPSLTEGTHVFSGDIVLNTGLDTIGQEVGKTGSGLGLDVWQTGAVNSDVQRGVQDTTTGGVLRGKVFDKVGTLDNASKTLLGFIPFFGAAKSLAKGAKQAAQSKDDWNRSKGVLVKSISEIEVAMQKAISEVNVENFGDIEIVTANTKNFLAHSRRTLQAVLDKYQKKSEELRTAIETWSEKHGEHVSLLTPELEVFDSVQQKFVDDEPDSVIN
jgi:hypothetical protein